MRKPKPQAQLRTVDLFSGKTQLEEAAALLEEEKQEERVGDPREMAPRQESTAIRWLGLDMWHQGDDVKLAVHPKGHAVLMLIREQVPGNPYNTSTIKLSKDQLKKLILLARELDVG